MNIANKTMLLLICTAFGLGCGYSSPQTAAPAISQLSPSAASAGSPALQLEVEGTNFVSGAVINFNGVAQVTTFVNSTKLETTIPAAAIANPANIPVTVTDPAKGSMYGGMGSVTSTPMTFTVN